MKKFFIFAIAGFIFFFFWYQISLRPVDPTNTAKTRVEVAKGMSTREIADFLEKEGFVRSSTAFYVYSQLHKGKSGLHAGSFTLSPSLSTADIVAVLQGGKAEEVRITIPEGYTVKDIDALLAKEGLSEPGQILQCARTCKFSAYGFIPSGNGLADRGGKVEGYLFPDTYFVRTDSFTPQSFLERLISTFEKRVIVDLKSDIAASSHSLHEIVTMASLIEEETRTADERAMVSGILWKRYEGGIGLGVDAAVRYIINKPTASITSADLEIDSPYNVRKYKGLPPGPIANAGLASIKAALHPKNSSYLFYLHGNDGVIRYAETNDQHNENKRKYLSR